jgi:hypothetical protein
VLGFEVGQRRRLDGPSQAPNPVLRLLETLPTFVAQSHEEGTTRPAVRSGIGAAMLNAFRPPAARSQENTGTA